MKNTTAFEIYNSFESTFSDKQEIPESLELQWLNMAVGKYNLELSYLNVDELKFDIDTKSFNINLNQWTINTLGQMMRVFYQEREVSRINKIASIVGKDLSVNGTNGLQKFAEKELEYHKFKLAEMIDNQKTPAYN